VCTPRGKRKSSQTSKSTIWLTSIPKKFLRALKENLFEVGFKESEVDPCLFISEKFICLVYVDDTLFFSPNVSDIDRVLEKLKGLKIEFFNAF